MNYTIVCNQPCRLRLNFGKYIFTKEQCYGLSELLLSFPYVTHVQVNEKNGSVLILHEANCNTKDILEFLSQLRHRDLKDGIPTQEKRNRELDSEFRSKLASLLVKRVLVRTLLPSGPGNFIACCRAIPFMRAAMRALKKKRMTVELLDATAIGVSLCCGKYHTASSTMFLLNVSDLLLKYANSRAKNALAHSLSIHIDKVWLVRDEVETQVPLNSLSVGDVIRLRKGTMIPVDGSIVRGDALINEATMTGEPLSVHKTIDGTVFAGTLLEDGEIDVCVRALSSESRIAKIIEMIDTGEEAKANIQSHAEHLADGIVPISFGLFFATLLLTGNVSRALSVLMVDFSCAIKLTTPITIISALKEATQNDIVIKGGKYLELLSEVDTVIFDKTGTLTKAVPKVSNVIVVDERYSEEKVLRIAACLEEHFPHSVAKAIVAEAKAQNLIHPEDHGKVDYIVAHGIASTFNGARSVIGSHHFVFDDEGVPYPYEQEQRLAREIGNDSAIYLAVDQELVGIICINDPPREDAKATIAGLRKEGVEQIIMITGDSEGTAKYVSESLKLDGYHASVLPDEKARIIEQLKRSGKTVLMVGDGINDTPALSCADVSLTLNGSSDIAREVADVTVRSDDLSKIITAIRLSKGVMRKVAKHYEFIVLFNTSLIGLGILGVLPAHASAWLHNASTASLAGISTRPVLTDSKENNDEKA